MCFWFPSNKYFSSSQDSTMIASWYNFFNGLVLEPWIQLPQFIANRGPDSLSHTLSSHVFVVTRKIDGTDNTIGKDWVIIPCRN